tara:strand:+ start:2597 stop:3871 length:1275 start_codon:yes stop_codon:yes gene_type:complete
VKQQLRALFSHVLDKVDSAQAMHIPMAWQQRCRGESLLVIAFGKAARRMAGELPALLPNTPMRGLVVPPEQDAAPLPPFEILAGGHPLPTEGSLRAGRRALQLARSVRHDEVVLFLISGGGSAMLEAPADDAVTLEELRALNQGLIASGAKIEHINIVRRHLSALKGGRLALAAAAAKWHCNLVISDVPEDATPAIASGPTVPESSSLDDCREILDRYSLWPLVPAVLQQRMQRGDLPPPMPPMHAVARASEMILLLNERHASAAAIATAHDYGWVVDSECDVDDWPYQKAAARLLQRLEELHLAHPGKRVAVVATGELSVTLPPTPGIGGRNVQFALHCATRIEGQPITVLSGGTDGIDGNSPVAGAIADGTTVARAQALGLDVNHHLERCDAFPLLDALGDCLKPGPTGTNVRDVRVLVRDL